MSLIIIHALPRSGSTWLQRVLLTHPEVEGLGESWIYLFLYNAFKVRESKYIDSHLINIGIEDIENVAELRGVQDFRGYMFECAKDYLEGLKNGKFYLEKTPRNYLVSDDLMRLKGVKHIVLMRDPVDIWLSIRNTWMKGRMWRWMLYKRDFTIGLRELDRMVGIKGVLKIDYESLISSFTEEIEKIETHIDLDLSLCAEEGVKELAGRLGDPSYREGKVNSKCVRGISYWDKRVLQNFGIHVCISNNNLSRFCWDMVDYYIGYAHNIYTLLWKRKYL